MEHIIFSSISALSFTVTLDKRGVRVNIFLLYHENICCEYTLQLPP